jgi:hypothetical protein
VSKKHKKSSVRDSGIAITNLGAMANIHTMDQYLSLLGYFLIITIAKLQYNYQ